MNQLPVLPTELTPAVIREAILPTKIIVMEKAISECTDPYLLHPYSRLLEGMAAAARILKNELPEQYSLLNKIAKNCQIRLGQLLTEWSNAYVHPKGKYAGSSKSPRAKLAESIGLKEHERLSLVALARGSEELKSAYISDNTLKPAPFIAKTRKAGKLVKPDPDAPFASKSHSEALRSVLQGRGSGPRGVSQALYVLKKVDDGNLRALTVSERALVRGVITEIEKQIERINAVLDKRD